MVPPRRRRARTVDLGRSRGRRRIPRGGRPRGPGVRRRPASARAGAGGRRACARVVDPRVRPGGFGVAGPRPRPLMTSRTPYLLATPAVALLVGLLAAPLVLLVRVSLYEPAGGRGFFVPGTWTLDNF